MATLNIKDLVITIDTNDPKSYLLKDGMLKMKMHIKGPKFEGDVTIEKWICSTCYELNEEAQVNNLPLDTICCSNCGMERPGESNL